MSTEPITGLTYQEPGSLQTDALQNELVNYLGVWLNCAVLSVGDTVPPGAPVNGDRYIVGASATGAWATHDDELAIYRDGWQFYAPGEGYSAKDLDSGDDYEYVSAAWTVKSGGGGSTQGKHAIPVMAGAIAPSVSGGCATLASIASAANQPDIVTLDFDTTTQEYAQFAVPMPKSWDEGTITALFNWSHAATTTNFGVVWNIQAVAVSNDDTIAVNFGTAQQVADTGGTTNDLYVTSETPAITVGGSPANGDTVFFRVSRVTGDGSDNMAIDARLHSVVLFITTDADTDA